MAEKRQRRLEAHQALDNAARVVVKVRGSGGFCFKLFPTTKAAVRRELKDDYTFLEQYQIRREGPVAIVEPRTGELD